MTSPSEPYLRSEGNMAKVPQLRKGLTREDLLRGTWISTILSGDTSKSGYVSTQDIEAYEVCLSFLDFIIERANSGKRVSRRDITELFTAMERFSQIRSTINERITNGELTPTLLDELVQ